jgi:uncharacterized Ntn-hydrolase superfamily protein
MTYSIIAHDPDTGEFGAAVQSHWFNVGAVVPWAQPGVGAVATQATALPAYGPQLLELMRGGRPAGEALAERLAADEMADTRQVAAIDAHGNVAAHTGKQCMVEAGHVVGDRVSCQGNIMRNRSVWDAMLEAYNASKGALSERLLIALEAAEAAGGDIRGKQSAAILVVPAEGEWWETKVSLRVEDHPEPLPEIRRLLRLNEAYRLADEGDQLLASGKHEEARALYRRSNELAPGNHELLFWSGLTAAASGDIDTGVKQVREAIALHPEWAELMPRLGPETAPGAEQLGRRLGLS